MFYLVFHIIDDGVDSNFFWLKYLFVSALRPNLPKLFYDINCFLLSSPCPPFFPFVFISFFVFQIKCLFCLVLLFRSTNKQARNLSVCSSRSSIAFSLLTKLIAHCHLFKEISTNNVLCRCFSQVCLLMWLSHSHTVQR